MCTSIGRGDKERIIEKYKLKRKLLTSIWSISDDTERGSSHFCLIEKL